MIEFEGSESLSPISKLVEAGWKGAADYIQTNQSPLRLQFTAEDAAGDLYIFLVDSWETDAQKESMLKTIEAAFAEKRIVRYVYASEVWAVKRDAPLAPGMRPSEQADRSSALMVAGVDSESGEILTFIGPIEDGEPRKLGERQVLSNAGNEVGGRMTQMLGPLKSRTVH
jgi:hypothetical protein